jgi:GT2 family glycosyltransferase
MSEEENTMSNRELLTELALRKGIQSQMDTVVHAATQATMLLKGDSKMEKNQIRNALNVADESNSVAVVTNFIRYQIGRSRPKEAWQYGGFGLQVITDLEEAQGAVPKAAQGAADEAKKELERRNIQVSDTWLVALRRDAHQELMCYYLGYLNRAFNFGTSKPAEMNAWDQLAKAVPAG